MLTNQNAYIRIFDDLSRRGAVHNLSWLRALPGSERLDFVEGDVRNAPLLHSAARDVDEIYHLAAQVAVTYSVIDPRNDFEVNTIGTFNVLEAARHSRKRPFLLFTSTNKVYGSLHGIAARVKGTRYCADKLGFKGINESEPLDFHSPYGCSKGAAD